MQVPNLPPAVAQHIKASDTEAKNQADKRAREAASRAIESATRDKGRPKTSGK